MLPSGGGALETWSVWFLAPSPLHAANAVPTRSWRYCGTTEDTILTGQVELRPEFFRQTRATAIFTTLFP